MARSQLLAYRGLNVLMLGSTLSAGHASLSMRGSPPLQNHALETFVYPSGLPPAPVMYHVWNGLSSPTNSPPQLNVSFMLKLVPISASHVKGITNNAPASLFFTYPLYTSIRSGYALILLSSSTPSVYTTKS